MSLLLTLRMYLFAAMKQLSRLFNKNLDVARASTYAAANYRVHYLGFEEGNLKLLFLRTGKFCLKLVALGSSFILRVKSFLICF